MVPQLVGIAVPVVTASLSLLSEAAAPDPTRPRCDFVHADGSHCECDGVNRISSLDSDIVAALWKIKHVEDPMHTRLRPMRWVGTNTDFMTERAASDAVDKDMRFCDTHVSKEDFESFRVVRDSYAGNAVQRELDAFKEMCDEQRDAGKVMAILIWRRMICAPPTSRHPFSSTSLIAHTCARSVERI